MSRPERIAKRARLVEARKGARKAHELQMRAAQRGGMNYTQASTMASFFARTRFAQLLAWLSLSSVERKRMKELKRLRDSMVLDWRQSSPAAGQCGECLTDSKRRWSGVGFDPDGKLFEANNVCPTCASSIEGMARRDGYTTERAAGYDGKEVQP